MDVAKRIRILREKSGMSQNQLAIKAGVSQSHLRRVELGKSDITIGFLQLLCDALGISISEFFDAEIENDELSSAISNLSPKQKALLVEFLKSL